MKENKTNPVEKKLRIISFLCVIILLISIFFESISNGLEYKIFRGFHVFFGLILILVVFAQIMNVYNNRKYNKIAEELKNKS